MATVTLSVPDELKEKMASFPELNWSAVARTAIAERIKLLEEMNRKLSKSTLTQEETIALGRKVKRAVAKKNKGRGSLGRGR